MTANLSLTMCGLRIQLNRRLNLTQYNHRSSHSIPLIPITSHSRSPAQQQASLTEVSLPLVCIPPSSSLKPAPRHDHDAWMTYQPRSHPNSPRSKMLLPFRWTLLPRDGSLHSMLSLLMDRGSLASVYLPSFILACSHSSRTLTLVISQGRCKWPYCAPRHRNKFGYVVMSIRRILLVFSLNPNIALAPPFFVDAIYASIPGSQQQNGLYVVPCDAKIDISFVFG